jgi:non-specific serine/threonine protein kinase
MLCGVRTQWLLPVLVSAVVMGAAGCSGSAPSSPTSTAPTPVVDSPDYRWKPVAPAPYKRTEVTAGVLGGRIWVLGGYDGSGTAVVDVGIYDPNANTWSAGPPLPESLHHATAASDGSRLWVVGGYTHGTQLVITAAVRYTDAGGVWRDGPPLPEPRAAGALVWDGRRLLFGGGVGPHGLAGDVFALEDGRWRRVGALSVAREHLAAASDGQGNTWFLAGRLGPLDTNRSDVDLVNADKIIRLGQVGTARGGVAGFHVPGLGGCVAGGEQPTGTFNTVECIKLDGSTTTLPALITPRHGLAAAVVDGAIDTLLGGPTPNLAVSDVAEVLRIPMR